MEHGGLFETILLEVKDGFALLQMKGDCSFLQKESGGHRWMRVPPNEKRGRVHTSTITVAILEEPTENELVLLSKDVHIQPTRGSGAGGQNRNKVETAIQATHIPTGLQVRCESERSQIQNKRTALQLLFSKLQQAKTMQDTNAVNSSRREQIGTGYRGDKIRTVRVQDGLVVNETTKKKISLKKYLDGDIDDLIV